jgi:hypothetical protein
MKLYRASADRKCINRCRIAAGDNYYKYRERALSHHEAMHAGTAYPTRTLCVACAEIRIRHRNEAAAEKLEARLSR